MSFPCFLQTKIPEQNFCLLCTGSFSLLSYYVMLEIVLCYLVSHKYLSLDNTPEYLWFMLHIPCRIPNSTEGFIYRQIICCILYLYDPYGFFNGESDFYKRNRKSVLLCYHTAALNFYGIIWIVFSFLGAGFGYAPFIYPTAQAPHMTCSFGIWQ